MKEKILTEKLVKELGFNKLSVITADMIKGFTSIEGNAFYCCRELRSIELPNSITSIGGSAFCGCSHLTSVIIPNSVTSIGLLAFDCCRSLTSVTIPNSVISIGYAAFIRCVSLSSIEIPDSVTSIKSCAFSHCNFIKTNKTDDKGRIIAYKGFNADMTCRNFQYKEGETYELDFEPMLCRHGFHACTNPLDCFGYYYGQIGTDVVFHEVYIEGLSDENYDDSKVVAKKITVGREISLSEMADIASGRK